MTLGNVCHIELRVRELEKAKAFYTSVFDWQVQPFMPTYWGIDTGASPGGGLFALGELPAPPAVVNYLLTDDVEAAAQRAVARGAQLLVPKQEVPGMGFFVDTLDPWGNEIAFWQAADASPPPAPKGSGKNGFCWVELSTPALADTVRYYAEVAGLKLRTSEDGTYAFTEHGGDAIGLGIMGGDGPRRLGGACTYIDVDDLEQSAQKVVAAGGKILFGPAEIPGTGTFTMFTDPDGIRLALFKGASRDAK